MLAMTQNYTSALTFCQHCLASALCKDLMATNDPEICPFDASSRALAEKFSGHCDLREF